MADRIKGIWDKAKQSVQENEKLQSLGEEAKEKLTNLKIDNEAREEFASKVKTLTRMIKAHISGMYQAFSGKTLLLITFALLYFIIPTDLIPDFIPALGLADDITLVFYIVRSLSTDLDSFLEWENQTHNETNID